MDVIINIEMIVVNVNNHNYCYYYTSNEKNFK